MRLKETTREQRSSDGCMQVRMIVPDATGTRLAGIDGKNDGFVYSPVDDSVLEIPKLPASTQGFVWDITASENILLAYTQDKVLVYMHQPDFVSDCKRELEETRDRTVWHVLGCHVLGCDSTCLSMSLMLYLLLSRQHTS
jgi:hypothetical protein